MAKKKLICPQCGGEVETFKNPLPTVDIIIETGAETGAETGEGIVLIHRKNEPRMWAIPGGFVDYGESLEDAAVREAKEETGMDVTLVRQFHAYSDPARDKRVHTVSVVFIGKSSGTPKAADDADDIGVFTRENLPGELAFDHAVILKDYFEKRY